MEKIVSIFMAAAFLLSNTAHAAEEAKGALIIKNPQVEGYSEQLGIEEEYPSFSWALESEERGQRQTAYRIIVSESKQSIELGRGDLYDSGKVPSSEESGILYKGPALLSQTKYFWKVFVWDKDDNMSESETLSFITGFVDSADWSSKWIGNGTSKPFYARKSFMVNKTLKSAFAYVSGLGQFKLYLNGEKVGDHELDPGWTDYNKQVQYVTFDVTDLVKTGENAVGVSVGNGWYIADKVNHFYSNSYVPYGTQLPLICEIVLNYSDGTKEKIISDTSWKVSASATTAANVYGSEYFDARLYPEGWNSAGFDDGSWENAVLVTPPKGVLAAQKQPPVKVKKVYDTQSIININATTNIFDLGQNMSGMFEIYVSGPAGAVVKITPVEKLNADKTIAKTTNTYCQYTLKGTGDIEIWKPDFSYVGARWVQIENAEYGQAPVPGKTVIHDVKGYFVTNSAEDVGSFQASDERYNRIYQLILRAIESNLQSVHTDCPTIEKLGWLETSHLMLPSILYNKNGRELFSKITRDTREAQQDSGLVPDIAPTYAHFSGAFWDSPAWGSAAIVTPWLLYQFYGDTKSLIENYDAMKKYAAYLKSKEVQGGLLDHGLGDWGIEPGIGESQANIETALYYYDLCILRDTAKLLNNISDSEYYAREAERIKDNYNAHLLGVDPETGRWCYQNITQANQAIALHFDLVPKDKEYDVLQTFIKALSGRKIASGEIGLRFIFQVAAKYGLEDIVQEMIMQDEHRSYIRFVNQGETTLPEFWVDNARSRNHDMLGHIMEWFYSSVGGISSLEPGFNAIKIAPNIPKDLKYANCEYKSVKGRIKSGWSRTDNRINLSVTIPPNTTGEIHIPLDGLSGVTITEGKEVIYQNGAPQSGHPHILYKGMRTNIAGKMHAVFTVDSGTYNFEVVGDLPLSEGLTTVNLESSGRSEIYVNGNFVCETEGGKASAQFELLEGNKVIGIKAYRPEGGKIAVRAEFTQGSGGKLKTGSHWKSSQKRYINWSTTGFDDHDWENASADGDMMSADGDFAYFRYSLVEDVEPQNPVLHTRTKYNFVVNENPAPGYVNLAKNKTVTTSSDIANYGWSAKSAVDGNTGSVSGAMGWSSNLDTSVNHTEWFAVDLGGMYDLSRIDLYPRNDAGYAGMGFPIDFTIDLSEDGVTWRTVRRVANYPAPTSGKVQSFSFAPTPGRYIRVTGSNLDQLPDGYRMQFAEVQVFGGEDAIINSIIYEIDKAYEAPEKYGVSDDIYEKVGKLSDTSKIANLDKLYILLGKKASFDAEEDSGNFEPLYQNRDGYLPNAQDTVFEEFKNNEALKWTAKRDGLVRLTAKQGIKAVNPGGASARIFHLHVLTGEMENLLSDAVSEGGTDYFYEVKVKAGDALYFEVSCAEESTVLWTPVITYENAVLGTVSFPSNLSEDTAVLVICRGSGGYYVTDAVAKQGENKASFSLRGVSAGEYYIKYQLPKKTEDYLYSGYYSQSGTKTDKASAEPVSVYESGAGGIDLDVLKKDTVPSGAWISTADFSTRSFGAYTGTPTVEFDVTPLANNIDGYIGYTGAGNSFSSYSSGAIIVRMNTDGYFDYRSGSSYIATSVSYRAGETYHVKIAVNLSAKTYDISVARAGKLPERIYRGAAFRSDAGTVSNLGKVCIRGGSGAPAGQFYVTNHTVTQSYESEIAAAKTETADEILVIGSLVPVSGSFCVLACFDGEKLVSAKKIELDSALREQGISARFDKIESGEYLFEPKIKIFVFNSALTPKAGVKRL